MDGWVVGLDEVGRADVARVGGKAASLGELMRLDGVRVPDGFVVTTAAFRGDVAEAVTREVLRRGERVSWAVRSSATGEDSTAASFAGQYDSFLDVVGPEAVLDAVRRCWASLSADRAAAYAHRGGEMAVVVQRMVHPRVSGVLFTADPVTGNRTKVCIEATAGLGDGLVSGRVAPEDGLLTHDEVAALTALGRRIEAHLGAPQDIEWCLDDDGFHVVQSRPITTLFPIPEAPDDGPRVYVSVGHQQMMTDAMKPLGLSLFRLTALRPMVEAGGRLFVDVTPALASPAMRPAVLGMLGRGDPRIRSALQALLDRGFVPSLPAAGPAPTPPALPPLEPDPALVPALMARTGASLEALARELPTKAGEALLDFILADLDELKRLLGDPETVRVLFAAFEAAWWLDDHLGEPGAADALSRSVPHDVTAEMGLALLDVADVIRARPAVVAFLREADGDGFLDALDALDGGPEARRALEGWLDRYGMRGVGEIDVTRPRWRERPSMLLPVLLGHVDHLEPGEAARRVEEGERAAEAKAREVLAGAGADEARLRIDQLRAFMGYREFPKYGLVCRYALYKQALLREAARLVDAGVLRDAEDVFFLTFDELREVVRTRRVDEGLLRRRRDEHRAHQVLVPPRVLTSEGEGLSGELPLDGVPDGALVGLAVSAGVVEGRARVVLDLAAADLGPGDVLVTRYTDPSWTPVFVRIAGLVAEVGGRMTHGAVVARELGLPAVVGVDGATRRIRDGQRIRVDGAAGTVELL